MILLMCYVVDVRDIVDDLHDNYCSSEPTQFWIVEYKRY
jgi:hypothetical protein